MPVLRALGKRQTIGMLALIAIPLVVALLASGWFLQVGLTYQPDTQSYCIVNNVYGGGGFADVPTDTVKRGEMFDSGTYYYSWAMDGTSQTIAVQGAVATSCPGNLITAWDPPTVIRYFFTINNGNGFVPMKQDDFPEGFIEVPNIIAPGQTPRPGNLQARPIHIDGTTFLTPDKSGKDVEVGIVDGAIFRVELQLGYTPTFGSCCEWKLVAQDESQFLSALADVTRGKDQYQVGETGRFTWQIPVSSVEGVAAYYLSVTNENDQTPVGGWDRKALTTLTGAAEFEVTTGMFVPGQANRVRARLYSQVFQADITDVTVIDDAGLAPKLTSVSFNAKEFREGDQVVVAYTATPNPTSASPIARYHVLAHIGGFVAYDQDTTSTQVSFIAARTGVLQVEVTAYDQAGRPSPVFEVAATVGNVIVDCEVHPELPQCGGGGGGPDTPMVILGVVLLVAGVAMGLFSGQLPLPQSYKLLLMVVGVILAIIGGAILVLTLIAWAKSIFPFALEWGGRT